MPVKPLSARWPASVVPGDVISNPHRNRRWVGASMNVGVLLAGLP